MKKGKLDPNEHTSGFAAEHFDRATRDRMIAAIKRKLNDGVIHQAAESFEEELRRQWCWDKVGPLGPM
jgi:hypothetical protein